MVRRLDWTEVQCPYLNTFISWLPNRSLGQPMAAHAGLCYPPVIVQDETADCSFSCSYKCLLVRC